MVRHLSIAKESFDYLLAAPVNIIATFKAFDRTAYEIKVSSLVNKLDSKKVSRVTIVHDLNFMRDQYKSINSSHKCSSHCFGVSSF